VSSTGERVIGYSLQITNLDHEFANMTRPPILVNHFNTKVKEDKERLNRLLYTHYEGDALDVLPSCDCGKLRGEFNVGIICNTCRIDVRSVTERPLESILWMAPPKGVSRLINPHVWVILSRALMHSNQSLLEWMCSPTYVPPGPPNKRMQKLMDLYRARGIDRGINTFYDKFDYIFGLLQEFQLIKGKKQVVQDLVQFVSMYRECIFTNHLPLPSRLGFITEGTVTGMYADTSMTKALDAARTISATEHPMTPLTLKVRQSRAVSAIMSLAQYYQTFISASLASKPGLYRKHIFGTRLHFSGRAVISSLSDNHNYGECYLPWSMSVMIFKTHITSKLIQRGYTPNMCIQFIYEHTLKYHPLMDQLFQELVNEAPVDEDGLGGIPIILHRNPSLQRQSAQMLKVTKIKPSPEDNTISMSTLILKGPNADFDGKALPSLNFFNCWKLLLNVITTSATKVGVEGLTNITVGTISSQAPYRRRFNDYRVSE
jgi:hypothetical protein